MENYIRINGARENNLKNITAYIPKNKFVVLTGLSGSGKSSLAFDILHKEGQRQYLESLGLVTDYLSKPNVDSITGLSPSISINQHLTNRSPRSTVGTETEIYTYLRVLYAKLGHRICPKCKEDIPPCFKIGNLIKNNGKIDIDDGEQKCLNCSETINQLNMAHFSFNKIDGACPTCTGLGKINKARLDMLIDMDKSILENGVVRWDVHEIKRYSKTLTNAGKYYGFVFDTSLPIKDLGEIQRDLLFYGVESQQFIKNFPEIEVPTTTSRGRFEGVVTNILRRYSERIEDKNYREKVGKYIIEDICHDCNGDRLKKESREVTVADKTIIELSKMSIYELQNWLIGLPEKIDDEEKKILKPIFDDLIERMKRIIDLGIGYLGLERSSPTLSAGEAQRLRLSSLLGSGLTGVLYVFDEPTKGLHQRDTMLIINKLKELRDLGNTVLVIEHDMEVIKSSDYIIDIGPEAGRNGGQIVAEGPPMKLKSDQNSATVAYMKGKNTIPVPKIRRKGNGQFLMVNDAYEHNLKKVSVKIPLGKLVAVTGVSGSGKSTLIFDVLGNEAEKYFTNVDKIQGKYKSVVGLENLDSSIKIDQREIGRSPRSNAATYTEIFTFIRNIYSETKEARIRKLSKSHFSFNVKGGRCENCKGAGVIEVSMHFLPAVQVCCPACKGKRFSKEVLEVMFKGYNISDILDKTIEEALDIFSDAPTIVSRLSLLNEVGLGYIKLGQPATTFSGGEAQRIKLARELGKKSSGRYLYLLDEPTTGLHVKDTSNLIKILNKLVDLGNTVVVVEHNMDLIKMADWIIDLGPEGGKTGGKIVVEGTPEEVVNVEESYTGKYLKSIL